MGNSSAAFGFPAKTGSIAISAYKLRTNGHFSAFLWLLFPCTSLHGMERKAQDFQRFSAYQMVLVCTRCILPYITPWRLVRMRSPVRIWLAAPERSGLNRGVFSLRAAKSDVILSATSRQSQVWPENCNCYFPASMIGWIRSRSNGLENNTSF